jgi:hypothetical protein
MKVLRRPHAMVLACIAFVWHHRPNEYRDRELLSGG